MAMAMGNKPAAVVFLLVLLGAAEAKPLPVVFILGDSTADVGTNTYLAGSNARADFSPNGIDFPHGARPTGRFSNGLNTADFIAKLLGHKRSPPPFLSLNGSAASVRRRSSRGINFASGGCGLLDTTGSTVGNELGVLLGSSGSSWRNVISLNEQVNQVSHVRKELVAVKGEEATKRVFSKSLFFISVGSNDIFGYYISKSQIPKQQFLSTLGLAYQRTLKRLVDLGAKKFGIVSIPAIGCCPSQRVLNSSGGCFEAMNDDSKAFHAVIESILVNLTCVSKDIKYSLANSYTMTMDVINNPTSAKLRDVKSGCCGNGRLNAEAPCDGNAKLCAQRNDFLFWDSFHPTQAASNLAALTLFGTTDGGGPGTTRYVAPINFAQLAHL